MTFGSHNITHVWRISNELMESEESWDGSEDVDLCCTDQEDKCKDSLTRIQIGNHE